MSDKTHNGIGAHEMVRNAIQLLGETLAAFTLTSDDMTASTTTFKPGSHADKISALQVDESHSYVRAVDPTMTVARIPAELPMLRQQVRNAVMPSVARARQHTGHDYRVEVGDIVMPSGTMFVVAAITRSA